MHEVQAELERYHVVRVLDDPITPERIRTFMSDLDVVYVEWCASYMVAVTKKPKPCPIVNRLHRGEMYGPWLGQVDFTQIDTLIFVNDFLRDQAVAQHPAIGEAKKLQIIQLGVDTDFFTFDRVSSDREYGRRIGWVGYLKPRKNPLAMLDLMRDLPDWDLTLHAFPSAYPDLTREVEGRVAELPNVVWDIDFMPREELPAFYSQFDVFINTSTEEGQGVAILEAMSCGVYTQIAEWPHARELYTMWEVYDTQEELVRRLRAWEEMPVANKQAVSQAMRSHVVNRYHGQNYVRNMREAIENAYIREA